MIPAVLPLFRWIEGREVRHRALLLGHQPFASGPAKAGGAYADIDACNGNSHRYVYLLKGIRLAESRPLP